jgi:Polyketide cyclase / dehydrase and lipid transport
MIAGEGTELIHRTARDIYEFVLDPERYKKADLKIGTVYSLTWRGDRAEIHYSGRFRGLPTPSVRQLITVDPHRRVDVRSIPGTVAHFFSRFHGTFTFEELGGGVTRVYHREELDFPTPLRWFVEPLLRAWLEGDTPQEVQRLKMLLEASPDADAHARAG